MPAPAELVTSDPATAVRCLLAGSLVAIPTETVYGLAADAEHEAAVERIFTVKGRPPSHPLIVHLADADTRHGWIGDVDAATALAIERLALACWPGPLTMLVPRGPRVSDLVTGGRPTVGLRVPAHTLTSDVLRRFGGGVAAPSANRFGKVSPTTAGHVLDDLGDLLDPARDRILDGGPSAIGVESTIVDLTCDPPQLLRAGAIDAATISRILALPIGAADGPSRASGMLAAHYTPDCEVLPAETRAEADAHAVARRAGGQRVEVLDRTGDLVAAAHHLYADLREADQSGLDVLVVVLPPADGIGHTLRDRLLKAAAGTRDRSSRAD